jgi:hypothetical protein
VGRDGSNRPKTTQSNRKRELRWTQVAHPLDGRAGEGQKKCIAPTINREGPGKGIVQMDNQYSQTFNWGKDPTALVSIARTIEAFCKKME